MVLPMFTLISILLVISVIVLWVYLAKKHKADTRNTSQPSGSKYAAVVVGVFLSMVLLPRLISHIENTYNVDITVPTITIKSSNQHSTITTTSYATVMYGGTWWVPYEHLDEWITALQRRDVARLTEMANTHKTFKVDRDTVVLRSDSGIYSGVVFITFQEGKYSGLSGYTLSNCVRE